MGSATAIVLLAFVGQAAAGGRTSHEDEADKLVDNFLSRAAPLWSSSPQGDTALEATALAKAAAVGNLAVASRAQLLPAPAAALGRRRAPSFRAPSGAKHTSVAAGRLPDVVRSEPTEQASLARRETLALGTLLGLGAALGSDLRPASAEAATETFYGTAFPPGTYGSYVNQEDKAVYQFDYPTGWEPDPLSKVDRGSRYLDCRVFNPDVKNKGEQVYVVVLSRAGEGDTESFKLDNPERMFTGFAIADPDLNSALTDAEEVTNAERTKDGRKFYDYNIRGPGLNYLSSVTVFEGKLFALFVKGSGSKFKKDLPKLQNIVSTFKMTGRSSR